MLYSYFLQLEACIHPFFYELRDPNARLPNGRPFPPLFNFKPQGLLFSIILFFCLDNCFQRTSHWLQAYSIADALHLQSWKGQARSSYQNWFQNMHESNVPSLVSRFQHVLLDIRVSLLY